VVSIILCQYQFALFIWTISLDIVYCLDIVFRSFLFLLLFYSLHLCLRAVRLSLLFIKGYLTWLDLKINHLLITLYLLLCKTVFSETGYEDRIEWFLATRDRDAKRTSKLGQLYRVRNQMRWVWLICTCTSTILKIHNKYYLIKGGTKLSELFTFVVPIL